MISVRRRRAARWTGERDHGQGRGNEGGGCYSSRMEMGEVFKTAGFRRARGRARGSCGDADRDDARRAVEGVADGLVPERHENTRGDLESIRRQPGGPGLLRKFGVRQVASIGL